MRVFRDLTLNRKITTFILLISSIGLLLVGVAIVSYEVVSYRRHMQEDLSALARIIADQNTAVLRFEDTETAQENLAALKGKREIMLAGIYKSDGKPIARFTRDNIKSVQLPSPPLSIKPLTDNVKFKSNYLEIYSPVVHDGETLGMVYIRSDLSGLYNQIMRYLGIVALVIIGVLGVTLLLSTSLQRIISDPILNLAKVANTVAEKKDYSVRVTAHGQDEVGQLVNAFNQMLAQIEQRETALEETNLALQSEITVRHRAEENLKGLNETLEQRVLERTQELSLAKAELERRVAERTAELSETNQKLEVELIERERVEAAVRHSMEEAERANRAKSEFLSRMSHELRTPLNAILGFGQLLEMGEHKNDDRESIDQVLAGGRHLLALVDEVLDISRIETGQLTISVEPINVIETLNGAITLVSPQLRANNIRLTKRFNEDVLFVMADLQRLRQILLNLLSNAIKYNSPDGSIDIFCEQRAEKSIRVTIADTGPGIAPTDLDKLFVPFERLGAAGRGIDGVGIGLALSKSLVELMGGRIGVESTVGQGSRFWFELPAASALPQEIPAFDATENQLDTVNGQTNTVLYIEDNISNTALVERIFSKIEGVQLLTTRHGRQGLEMVQSHQPNLVLLDRDLPDISGDEVLLTLQNDPATKLIPVIMISADATVKEVERVLAAGARDYLTKPIEVQRLIKLVTDILDDK